MQSVTFWCRYRSRERIRDHFGLKNGLKIWSLSVSMFMYMCILCIIDEYVLCLSRHNAPCNYSAWFVLLGFVLQLYFPVFVFVLRLYFPVTVFVFVCCVHRTLTAPGCCCSGLRTSLTAGESSGVARLPTPVLCCVPFSFLSPLLSILYSRPHSDLLSCLNRTLASWVWSPLHQIIGTATVKTHTNW